VAELRKRRRPGSLSPKQEEASRLLDEHERLAAYRATFAPTYGQKVLADLIRRAGVFATTETVDPVAVAFNEGRRQIVLAIINDVSTDPNRLARLLVTGDTEELFSDADLSDGRG
jgi:hypothetical protein